MDPLLTWVSRKQGAGEVGTVNAFKLSFARLALRHAGSAVRSLSGSRICSLGAALLGICTCIGGVVPRLHAGGAGGGAGTPEHGGAPRRFRVGVGSTYRNRAGAPGPYLPTPPPV